MSTHPNSICNTAAAFESAGGGQDWVRVGRVCQVIHFHNPLLKLGLCSFYPSKIGFVLHVSYLVSRISYFAGRGTGGEIRAPNIGRGCANGAKKVLDLGFAMLVSCFQEASKKNFNFWDFCFQVYAHLIEI